MKVNIILSNENENSITDANIINFLFKKIKHNLDVKIVNLNSFKSRKYVGWKPILSTKESLKLTIDWYKNYSSKKRNIYLNTLAQIISYKEKKLYNSKKMDR